MDRKEKASLYNCIELMKQQPVDLFYYCHDLNEEEGVFAMEVIRQICEFRPIRKIFLLNYVWTPLNIHVTILKQPLCITLEEIQINTIAGENDKGFAYLGKATRYLTNLKTLTATNTSRCSYLDAPLFQNWKFGNSMKIVRTRTSQCVPEDFFFFLKQNTVNIQGFEVEIKNLSSHPPVFKALVNHFVRRKTGRLHVTTDRSVNDFPGLYYGKVLPIRFVYADFN